MNDNIVRDKSFAFAIRIVRLCQYLKDDKNEYVLSKQLLRSGTSIGANIVEALDGVSRNDFLNKMGISLKECSETLYWIELLYQTDYLTQTQYDSIRSDGLELRKILASITKTKKDSRDTRR
ncbi:MAG: four helix bundle protein [Clostridia bacterium]|nr:four helix bundle protein [Clostridia bacterium]